jgi:CheY-like chemotaxis protein
VVNNHIDLVITDYHMPIMDGIAFIQWMHRNRYQVPIILLSGDMHEDLQAKIGPARIFAILKKPCSFSELYVKVLEVFHEPQFSSN